MRRALPGILVHVGQHVEVCDTVGSLFPPLDLPVLHNDVLVQEMALGADDQALRDPVVALCPPDLTLIEIGPIPELLDVPNYCQVLTNLRLILNRKLQIKPHLH